MDTVDIMLVTLDTWATVGASVVALAALFVSIWALYYSRKAATAATRAADAAERQADAAEQALPPPPPRIAWSIAKGTGRDSYVLRNGGTETATGVEIDKKHKSYIFRAEIPDGKVQSGGSVSLLMAGNASGGVPNELWLRWDGQPEWVAVPVR
ncbi:hypothetical protein ACN28C_03185 [Plantactinospora sp. WMMC1484]|uniref:hypothetical protein n=1 Tax=Plantactinospora sp. WMMC1484 TaxID=3404122 RepID=UPI003BF54818